MSRNGTIANRNAGVSLENVSRSFDDVHAVCGVSLEIEAGSFFSLLGPSGCGKSTTLRIIAGFERPDSGIVRIGNKDVTHLPPQKRPTAMVFQNYALFPHMSVSENVGYGLTVRKIDDSLKRQRVLAALRSVNLETAPGKGVTELSGGQQQRVALARALATEPDVLLFDEPLSNLDVELREQTRLELKRIQNELGITSIYVTHDQEEALALSDRMAIMKDGRIIQTGTPREIYDAPATAFVARFLGRSNILRGNNALMVAVSDASDGGVLAVRPEDIIVHTDGKFEGVVVEQQYLGRSSELWIRWNGIRLRVSGDSAKVMDTTVRFDVVASLWVRDDATG